MWWRIEEVKLECSVEELEAAIAGTLYISFQSQKLATDDDGIIGGVVSTNQNVTIMVYTRTYLVCYFPCTISNKDTSTMLIYRD